jgi:hypothetical protein
VIIDMVFFHSPGLEYPATNPLRPVMLQQVESNRY